MQKEKRHKRQKALLLIVITLLFAAWTFSGCNVQRKLDKYCPYCPVTIETIVQDSIIVEDTTIYKWKDTTIYVPLPFDTVSFMARLKPRKAIVNLDTITKESGIIGVRAWVIRNDLGVMGYIADSSLYYKISILTKERNYYKEKFQHIRDRKQKTIYKTKPVSKFYKWFTWIGIVIILLLIAYMVGKSRISKFIKKVI